MTGGLAGALTVFQSVGRSSVPMKDTATHKGGVRPPYGAEVEQQVENRIEGKDIITCYTEEQSLTGLTTHSR